jgi:hypothetical protein
LNRIVLQPNSHDDPKMTMINGTCYMQAISTVHQLTS